MYIMFLPSLTGHIKTMNDYIQIAIVIGTWLAAFAACFAACASLWIATRKKKHKISIKAYSGFSIKKDDSHNIGYIRCKKDSEILKKFSDFEPMLEIIIENRGDVPFFTHTLEVQINVHKMLTLNTIERVNLEDVQFSRCVEPGESTTYFYRFYSLIATRAYQL